MNDVMVYLDGIKTSGLDFLTLFIEWLVNSPTPFLLVVFFVAFFIFKTLRSMLR